MKLFSGIIFRHLYTAVCIIGVTVMVGFWFYKFDVEDRDIGVVDYKPLEEMPVAEIPVPTLCFQDPFKPKRLLDFSKYIMYLRGALFDVKLGAIAYGNVTLNLNDYFRGSEIEWRNGSLDVIKESTYVLQKEIFSGWIGMDMFYKCFDILGDIEDPGKIKKIKFYFRRKEIMEDMAKNRSLFYTINMNYPGQFLLAPRVATMGEMKKYNTHSTVLVKDVEVLRSRNSRNRKCTATDNIDSFDDLVLKKHLTLKRCRAPYMTPVNNYPLCDTQEKIKDCVYEYHNVRKKYYANACQRMSKIGFLSQSSIINSTNGRIKRQSRTRSTFAITINYPEYAKMITQSKEVDIHALIGNIGGYIGLFLGNDNLCQN